MHDFKAQIRAWFYRLPVPGTVYVLDNEPHYNVTGHETTVLNVRHGKVILSAHIPFGGVIYSLSRYQFHLLYKLYKGDTA